MKIGVDLRCLNYAKYTGINAYCIHILGCLSTLKALHQIEFVGIGLKKTRFQELQNEFDLFNTLFSSLRTLEEYNMFDIKNTKILELISCGQIYIENSLDCIDLERFDYLIQPQPRLIKLNPSTKLITFYHDVFDILEGVFRLNKILNNRKSWKLIAARSNVIITNSRSTSIDLVKFLDVDKSKINLIYPGTPNLDLFRNSTIFKNFRHPELDSGSPTTQTTGISKATTIKNNPSVLDSYLIINDRSQTNETKPFILAISGIEPRKNWHNLILAFKHLQINNGYDKKLILAGTIVDRKYYNYLQKLIQIHKVKNVEWVLEPNESVKGGLIKNSLFVTYPSFYEGFGFPILEAQKYKKNVLTSKNSSLVEINPSNIFIDPNNYISIANGVLLMTEVEFTESETRFSWDELLTAFEKMLIKC